MKVSQKSPAVWGLIVIVVLYMGFLVIAPIIALVKGVFQAGLAPVFQSLTSKALFDALWLSLKIAFAVVLLQMVLGTMVAWVMVRQNFRLKFLMNGLIDIPFMVSPVVVGYMLLLLFGRNGLLFPLFNALDVQIAFALPGMLIATLFVSLSFMIREMIPAIENLDRAQEFAAATLGANQWIGFWRIIFPQLKPALLYGLTLTLARALGEFGAVFVIGGGIQGRTETATLFIFRSLEERQFVDAYTAAVLLGLLSILVVTVAERFKLHQTRKKEERKF